MTTNAERSAIVRSLTIAGWFLVGGSIGLIAFQLNRVRSISGGGTAFSTAWEQRIEVLSFVMLPPNMMVLIPAATAAVAATWLAGKDREVWLVTLVRLVATVAGAMFVIGLIAIVNIFQRDAAGQRDIEGVYLRLGGVSMAVGIVILCWAAERFHSRD